MDNYHQAKRAAEEKKKELESMLLQQSRNNNRPEAELLKDSILLKQKLDDYINALNESRRPNPPPQLVSDAELRNIVRDVFNRERAKLSEEIVRQLERDPRGGSGQANLMEEFYRYCQEKLPHDKAYKESALFVTLFHYFLEKKKSGK